jgi:pyruvate dehydrogenase E1 component alpha subunit
MHYSFFAQKVPKSSLFCHLPMLGAAWKSAIMSESRFLPNFEAIAPFSRLTDSGILDSGESPMSDEAVLEALRYMMLTRVFDDKATSMQRQGRFGTFSSVRGQEASVVGAASALDPAKDWIVPQYREFPALIRHGYPIENFALYFMGNPKGGTIPTNVNMLPMQISLAAQIPQATGLAWGLKMQGGDGVAITFFGDGASSEGDFHESLNLAGIVKAPVIFFLQNNGWAISTPRENQTAARSFAERAIGYGVEGVIVDGNDLLAVHEVTARAVAKARAGGGPTLIESVTYRTGAHNTADDPTRYVDQQELEKWQQKDPVERIKNYLRSRGIWNEVLEQEMLDSCAAQIDVAMEIARNTPLATSDALFDHVYAEPPQRMQDQKSDWAIRNGGA